MFKMKVLTYLHVGDSPHDVWGGEVWGYNNIECLEIIQRKFLKYSLKLKSSTPTAMIYCETGYLSIETELKIKIITLLGKPYNWQKGQVFLQIIPDMSFPVQERTTIISVDE